MEEALTFDDVLLVPRYSEILPKDVKLNTKLTNNIQLNIPIISAAMDTVTESLTAIAVAREGGIGIIHRAMTIERQIEEVRKVKRSESLIVTEPMTIGPTTTLKEILILRERHKIGSFPVIKNGKLVGLITKRDLAFEDDLNKKAEEIMTTDLITVDKMVSLAEAKKILKKHKIEKLPIIDKGGRLQGLITEIDIRKTEKEINSLKDEKGRLMVGAAIGVNDFRRAEALINADVDVIVIDSSHGHSKNVIDTLKELKRSFDIDVIAGNVVTADACKDLLKAGADAIKVGLGPGSICTTRVIGGVGIPQLTAIMKCNKAVNDKVPIIADGGIRYAGDITKALGAGANSVMLGYLFAGCDETPSKTLYIKNRKYKYYRGMGSVSAMYNGTKDRYSQEHVIEKQKLVPEGVEAIVPYKGKISEVLFQLTGGLRAGMGLLGVKNIEELRKKCKFIKLTAASVRESHPHSIVISAGAPNYP